jgi:Leucine-rich repeat (LRR) protein
MGICLAGFDITQAQLGCQKLAGLLTGLHTDTIHQLACLTQLSCKVGPDCGSLQDLLQLSLLQSLEIREALTLKNVVTTFAQLQSLTLNGHHEEICNLQSCTQLTELYIYFLAGNHLKTILLPASSHVMLRTLGIWDRRCMRDHDFCLRSLSLVTRLERLYVSCQWLSNMGQVNLTALPSLREAYLSDPYCAMPMNLTFSTGLQALILQDYSLPSLPLWLSCMTQLRDLSVYHHKLDHFPESVLHLSQLDTLSWTGYNPAQQFLLSRRMLCLADWPNLTSCRLDTRAAGSQLLLEELRKLLSVRNPLCKFYST